MVARVQVALLFVVVALAGCGTPAAIEDAGGIDAGGMDAGPRADGGPVVDWCASDRDCAGGLRCFGGVCQADPCAGSTRCDADTERCVARCVPVVDRCAGVSCAADETCIDGVCFAGCLPSPCAGRTCPEGRYCDPSTGACRVIEPCRPDCGGDSACHVTCVPRTACEGVACAEGELCRDGECVANACFGVECEAGEVCSNGACVATCDCDPACAPPERCVGNRCVCVPYCPPGVACGEDDGCGGACDGTCPTPAGVCDVETGSCECTPRCPADAVCGADDGCGGRCDGVCGGAETCVGGACVCTDVCVSPAAIACGDAIPDTCAGSACRGMGTACPSDEECLDGRCCPPCAARYDVGCGLPIPDAVDESGAVCRECSGAGVRCTGGQACVASDATEPVCCGACPDPASVACGTPLPDAVDASGEVCRVCSLAYGTSCPAGQECTGGPRGECCEACAAPDAIACGAPIPDRACRTCSGVGSQCPAGTSCAVPPGASASECCPECPAPETVACGAPIPAVLTEGGAPCRDCGEGTMCPSGQVCDGESCCTPSCAPASTRACGDAPPDGCGGLCEPGTMCTGTGEACTGDPLACTCVPECTGRRCGDADGCGGECAGACDAGFVCAERPPPSAPGDYACEPSACVESCGLCESCVLGRCEPLACAAGQTVCLPTCECCATGEACTAAGCVPFG